MSAVELRWEDPYAAEKALLETAAEQLGVLLGPEWQVDQQSMLPARIDAVWRLIAPTKGSKTLSVVVEAKLAGLTPRMVSQVVEQLERAKQVVDNPDALGLLVAPYLSARTRQILSDRGISYMDTTGNVSIQAQDPTIVIRTEGAQRDPAPRTEGKRGISGARAGRLVRSLADYEPPRRGNELASSSELSESYVSRLVDILEQEALLRRRRKIVIDVDWPGLLRARASTYELMKVNHVVATVTRGGIGSTLERLREVEMPVLATGTYAANGFAPLVAGGALMLYVWPGPRSVDAACKDLGLMRVNMQDRAEVLLLQPMNQSVFDRPHSQDVDGVRIPALSQVVLDCLSGPGRLPAAGEALIDWMSGNEAAWRRPSPLPDVTV